MLAVPYAHDQPDNAWRAAGLGMARVLYPWKYRSAVVTRHLAALTEQGVYQQAAEQTAAVVRKEPGLAGAVEAIERVFRI